MAYMDSNIQSQVAHQTNDTTQSVGKTENGYRSVYGNDVQIRFVPLLVTAQQEC